jgi:hypothetical protein
LLFSFVLNKTVSTSISGNLYFGGSLNSKQMKKHFFRPAAAILMIAAIASTSCKKSDDTKSRKDIVVGNWSAMKMGYDSNNNGTMESTEVGPTSNYGLVMTMNVKGDGTGVTTSTSFGKTTTSDFSWNLADNDQTFRMIAAGDTSSVKIITLDNSNLTILMPAESGIPTPMWVVFNK